MKPVSSMSREEKHQAIQNAIRYAMRPYLDDVKLDKALELWVRRYADKPTFALQHFASECCLVFSLPDVRKELERRIIRYLALPESRRHSMSEQAIDGFSREDGVALPVFQIMINHVCADAGGRQGEGVRRYLIENLERTQMGKSARKAVEMWLKGNLPDVECPVSLADMRLMVNIAYVGLCECCGPVKADVILHAAVQKTSLTDWAKGFPPEGFL